MDAHVLGTRVRDARRAVDITQEHLSELLDIPRSAVSEIEHGRRGLSASELLALSKHLRRGLDYFVAGEDESTHVEDPFTVRFRSLHLDAADADAVFLFEQRCRDYKWLEEILDIRPLAPPPNYPLPAPRSIADAQSQGEDLAAQERNRLALGSDPVQDPFDVVESQGVRLLLMRLETPNVSGIFHYDDELGACILVNTAFDKNRRAFDLFHEYCHVLTDRLPGTHLTGDASDPGNLIERRANAFAAAFLLPRDGVDRFLSTRGVQGGSAEFQDIFYVMIAFGASFQATVHRLKELGCLHPTRAQAYLTARNITEMTARFRAAAGVKHHDVDDPRQRRFGQLALRAYKRGEISIGRVAELLEMDLENARDLAWAWRIDGLSATERAEE